MSNPNTCIYQFVRFALLVTLRMFEVMAVNACDVMCHNISMHKHFRYIKL